ncbi:MAG: NAD-dependent 4,6-dehydratase LegB [Candidatus Marinimicrobia bacterium]|nr:NAD-dependent 4,6-dehydratase LegB [Candidatus Neomarinimicrobiota bacterium]
MKVLVTGAGGFIGSHLTEYLAASGFEVRAFVRYNSNNRWGWLDTLPIKRDIEVITGDIRDYDSVYNAVKGCKVVFHLAALIGIPYSYISPLAYIKTNVEGAYNILQSTKESGVEQILMTSTSETYGTAQYIPIDEKHPLVGQSPYSATKIAADQLAISYYRSFGLPVKIVRPFNTYGPRQSARAVIPTIVTQILSECQTLKLGNLSPTRDLTYVKDTVAGFIKIFESQELFGEVTNIGMNQEISIGDLAKSIMEIMNLSKPINLEEQRIRPEDSEVEHLRCDNTKITTKTPWRPRYELIQGLTETINWIKENLSFYKAGIYNV